jgi:replicative DNA helicase
MNELLLAGDTPNLQPQAIAAEEQIIGALLWDANAYGRIEADLSPDHFYVKAHGRIYAAIQSLAEVEQPIDMVTVTNRLKDSGHLEIVGGQTAIARLFDSSVSAANIDAYAELVIDKAKRRELIQIGSEISRLGYDSSKSLAEILDEAEAKIFTVSQGTAKGGPEHVSVSVARLNEKMMSYVEGSMLGLPSGFYDLDAMTQGFQKSDLIIIAARPSMGKSALTDQIVHSAAENSGKPALIFSLEMGVDQFVARSISRESSIETGRLRTRRIADHEWDGLGSAQNKVASRPVFVDATSGPSISYIRSKCRECISKHGGLGMVALDYLQLMEGSDGNRVQELSKITRSLKNLARELDVPIIVLSQLSRGPDQRTNKRPMMSDLRDSGAIEQDADVIMMLYREEYYDADTPDRGVAEVIITKHRNGPTGTVKLLFQPEYTKFLNRAS